MAKTRTQQWLVILAAGLFVAALWPAASFGQTAQDKAQAQPRQQTERPRMGFLARELDLTPEQQKKLEELRKTRTEEFRTFRDKTRKTRQELRDLMNDPGANQAKIDGLIDKMSKLRADREKAAVSLRVEARKIFTPEQIEKIKSLRSRFMDRIGRAGRMGFAFRQPRMSRFMRMGRFNGLRGLRWQMFDHDWWF